MGPPSRYMTARFESKHRWKSNLAFSLFFFQFEYVKTWTAKVSVVISLYLLIFKLNLTTCRTPTNLMESAKCHKNPSLTIGNENFQISNQTFILLTLWKSQFYWSCYPEMFFFYQLRDVSFVSPASCTVVCWKTSCLSCQKGPRWAIQSGILTWLSPQTLFVIALFFAVLSIS